MAGKSLSFEQAMDRLSQIVDALERGDDSLDTSLKLYEEGTSLAAQCYKKLEKAEQKVRSLMPAEEPEKKQEDSV